MGLSIIARDGRSGQLIVKDERKDGAVVLFVCDPMDGSPAAIVDAASKADGRGKIPDPDAHRVLRDLDFTGPEPFKFTVDTSGLPRGPQLFEVEGFLTNLIRELDEGTTSVNLSLSNASDWGYYPGRAEDWLT
jgi:hypothetical protein